VLGDSEKSDRELLDEYSSIVTLTQRHEHALRVREIIDELLKRTATRHPAARKRRNLRPTPRKK